MTRRLCALISLTLAIATPRLSTATSWAERIGGIAADLPFAMAVDDAGNAYTVGTFVLVTDIGDGEVRGAGSSDIFVSKHDAEGRLIWKRTMGGTQSDEPRAAVLDAAGNLYVTGYFLDHAEFGREPGEATLTAVGGADAFVVKLSPEGDTLWARRWGGKFADGGSALAIAGDKLYVGGRFQLSVNFGSDERPNVLTSAGLRDGFVLELATTGDPRAAFRFGGNRQDDVSALAADAAGHVFVTGSFETTAEFGEGEHALTTTATNGSDLYLARFDPRGQPIWVNHLGGPQVEHATALRLGESGDLWLIGSFQGSLPLGSGDAARTLTSAGTFDAFASRWSGDGTLVWARNLGGAAADLALSADLSGDLLFIGGAFQDRVDFGTDGSSEPFASVDGTIDGFVVALDADGDTRQTLHYGAEGAEQVSLVAAAPSGGVRFAGTFNKTLTIADLPEPLICAGKSDLFLIRPGAASRRVSAGN